MMIINAAQCGGLCFQNLFKSYKYQQTNVVYDFLAGNELNIAFQIVILILQNYIQRNKLYHSIWNIFTVLGAKINNFC